MKICHMVDLLDSIMEICTFKFITFMKYVQWSSNYVSSFLLWESVIHELFYFKVLPPFSLQVMRIIENVQPGRQTVMFSATFPRQVEALAKKILLKPIEIMVRACANIRLLRSAGVVAMLNPFSRSVAPEQHFVCSQTL